MNEISNYDDLIDSRDVIARIDELESECDAWEYDVNEAQKSLNLIEAESDAEESDIEEAQDAVDAAETALDDWQADFGDELKALQDLAAEAEGYAEDWHYGETLIRDSYFQEYAEQFAEDIGAIDRDLSWPNNHIDWEAAAEALQQDYTAVDFDGVTYWVR